uniref:CCHC-type domain-containing protein n=1 Tax=Romanomermis culicivorax TaxID=13658 RepID=A0A915J880_ROMCU
MHCSTIIEITPKNSNGKDYKAVFLNFLQEECLQILTGPNSSGIEPRLAKCSAIAPGFSKDSESECHFIAKIPTMKCFGLNKPTTFLKRYTGTTVLNPSPITTTEPPYHRLHHFLPILDLDLCLFYKKAHDFPSTYGGDCTVKSSTNVGQNLDFYDMCKRKWDEETTLISHNVKQYRMEPFNHLTGECLQTYNGSDPPFELRLAKCSSKKGQSNHNLNNENVREHYETVVSADLSHGQARENDIVRGMTNANDSYKIALLESYLTADAQASLRELKKKQPSLQTFDDYVTELQVLYPENRDSDIHQQLIYDHKQKQTESVIEYYDQLQKHTSMEIKTSHDSAIGITTIVAQVLHQTQQTQQQNTRAVPYCTKCQKDGHSIENCNKTACRICHKCGHTATHCKAPCHNCGRMGHKSKFCKQPQRPADQEPICICGFCLFHKMHRKLAANAPKVEDKQEGNMKKVQLDQIRKAPSIKSTKKMELDEYVDKPPMSQQTISWINQKINDLVLSLTVMDGKIMPLPDEDLKHAKLLAHSELLEKQLDEQKMLLPP